MRFIANKKVQPLIIILRKDPCGSFNDKTSAPKVFFGCSFITRAHFETRLVMVGYYSY